MNLIRRGLKNVESVRTAEIKLRFKFPQVLQGGGAKSGVEMPKSGRQNLEDKSGKLNFLDSKSGKSNFPDSRSGKF